MDFDYDVFVSYSWTNNDGSDNSKRVKRIAEGLEKRGLKVWLDQNNMENDTTAAMAKGISSSAVVLVCATKSYMDKVNDEKKENDVKREYKFAHNERPGNVQYVALDNELCNPRCWTGVFKFLAQNELFIHFPNDDSFQDSINEIHDAIMKKKSGGNSNKRSAQNARLPQRQIILNFDPFYIPKSKAGEFVKGTRQWIFDALAKWDTKAFILVGGPGVGKSVVMGELCRRQHCFESGSRFLSKTTSLRKSLSIRNSFSPSSSSSSSKKKNQEQLNFQVAALHFFKWDDSDLSSAKQALLSIINQLLESKLIPDFSPEISDASQSALLKKDLRTLWRQFFFEPMAKCKNPGKPMVIVFDALDECGATDRENLIEILRSEDFASTPKWLKIIVTTRPEAGIPRKLRVFEPTELRTDDEKNMDDMEAYLRVRMKPRVSASDLEEAVSILKVRSQGLFLYARFIEHTLKEEKSGKISINQIKQLFPLGGLDAIYTKYFKRFKENALGNNHQLFIKILAPVAAARAPLPIEALASIVLGQDGSKKKKLKKLIDQARQLLVVDSNYVRFVHKSMSDWLLDDDNDTFDDDMAEEGHALLSTWCEGSHRPFAFRHCIYHQVLAEHPFDQTIYNCNWIIAALNTMLPEERSDWISQSLDDLEKMSDGEAKLLAFDVVRSLEMGVAAILRDPEQVASQLLGRIKPGHPVIENVHSNFKPKRPWLRPIGQTLDPVRSPLKRICRGQDYTVTCVACDQDVLVTGSGDKTVKVWSFSNASMDPITFPVNAIVTAVAVRVKDDLLLVTNDAKQIMRWKLSRNPSQQKPVIHAKHTSSVSDLALGDDFFVSASWDHSCRIWSLEEGGEQNPIELAHNDMLRDVILVENKFVVSAIMGGKMYVWKLEPSQSKGTPPSPKDCAKPFKVLEGYHNFGISAALYACENKFASLDESAVHVWNINDLDTPIHSLSHGGLAVSIDNNYLAVGGYDNETVLCVYEFNGSSSLEKPVFLRGHSERIACVSSHQGLLVTGSFDDSARIWDMSRVTDRGDKVLGHTYKVGCVVLAETSSDQKSVFAVSSSYDSSVRVWPIVENSKAVVSEPPITSLMFALVSCVVDVEKSRIFVAGSNDVVGLDLDGKREPIKFIGHTKRVECVALHKDRLISAGRDSLVHVWNKNDPSEPPIVLQGHELTVRALDVFNDIVVSGSVDNSIRVWDLKAPDADPILLSGHTGNVNQVRLFDNGTRVASCSNDQTVRIWDITTTKSKPKVTKRHSDWVKGLAISEDDRLVVSGGSDRGLEVFPMDDLNSTEWIGFTTDSFIPTCATFGKYVVVGETNGNVHFLEKMKS